MPDRGMIPPHENPPRAALQHRDMDAFRLNRTETGKRPLMDYVIAVLLAAGLSAPAEKTDAEKIQGTWVLTSITIVGEVSRSAGSRTIKFEGKTMTMFYKDQVSRRETFALDQSKLPKHIDITSEDVAPVFGIYEIDDDKLKICFFRNQRYYKRRPESFASDSNHRTTVYTYSRR